MRAWYTGKMEQEFSRPIRAGHIKEAPQTHIVIAEPAERAALAVRFGLPEISHLRGEYVLQHARAGIISAVLTMQARLTQNCVVTLEPFEARIEDSAQLYFVPAAKLPETEDLDPETIEGPDEIPYTGDMIDLGETLAEQLALALDPYPRKPGAELPPEAQATPDNPFSVLKFKK